jgi:two-component system, NarL family, nitrate/nitrite response regulator NarL
MQMIPPGGSMDLHQERRISVMLVDAHRMVLCGLQRLIEDEKPELGVVATATEAASALELAASTKPDVVLVDVGFATEKDGSLVTGLINGRNTRVLVLSGARDDKHELAILRGARGVVHKDETPQQLIKAIRKVHEGQLWLDRSSTGRLFVELAWQKSQAENDPAKRALATLTQREHDVVRSLVKQPGADNKTLASTLYIGEHTLRNHLSRIYDKLGVPNRLELYVFVHRHVAHLRPTH